MECIWKKFAGVQTDNFLIKVRKEENYKFCIFSLLILQSYNFKSYVIHVQFSIPVLESFGLIYFHIEVNSPNIFTNSTFFLCSLNFLSLPLR